MKQRLENNQTFRFIFVFYECSLIINNVTINAYLNMDLRAPKPV